MMVETKIPILDLKPEIESLWPAFQAAIERVVRSGRFIMGPEVVAFEQEIAAFLGVKHAIGVNSGTDALVIALKALGIGPGDEVITTPFTFFATAESISNVGATPVFVDVLPDSYNMDPAGLTAALTPRTRALMPVHLFGRAVDMDAVMAFADQHGLFVVEDCAQSIGSTWEGKQTGTLGHIGAFSFFPSKNLGAFGDGGLLVTNDDALADTANILRKHGARKKYHNEVLGYNSRLDAIQAAILRVKLPHILVNNAGRRRVASRYNALLAEVPGVVTPEVTPGHIFHQYTVRILHGKRDAVKAALAEAGISTMIYYPIPQDRLPIYDGQYPANPVSDQLSNEVLSLPIWPQCPDEVITHVAHTLAKVLKKN